MCDKVISEKPFVLKHCHDKYKTQKKCDKAVDSYLLALKFVPGWFATSKVIKKLNSAAFSNDDKVSADLDSNFFTFFSNDVGLNSITLDNFNLDDNNFDGCDPKTISHIGLIACHNRFKQAKHLKRLIDEELQLVVWHRTKV